MRNPIQDANEGAAMQVVPTKKHAVRTATVAKQGNNAALEKQRQVNQIASKLGNAIGNFVEGKRKTENEQRYMQAYHEQGTAEGLSEFQKDMKHTGFTEFIYGGQTPEYKGALDASARNASNAMYIEEAEFIEGEGGDLTPDQYRERMQNKLTKYNAENFSDAPDAAFAFMSNWQDNSNELSKQQVKLYKVRQQEKARLTVAEGWQTDLDVYKTIIKTNPNKAAELGREMFSGKHKPKGMDEKAYRAMLVSESMTAIRAHDFSALQLLNESGLVKTFDEKELKQYEQVRTIIDVDNFNTLEASRLAYEAVIENPLSTANDVETASNQYDSSIIQVAARNTGSSKHMKTAFGADRHRGVLGKQYRKRLTDEADDRLAERVGEVEYNSDIFDATLMQEEPKERRKMLSDRLDDLAIAIHDPELDREVRKDLAKQIVVGTTKLEKWESADAMRKKTAQVKIDKANQAELDLNVGVKSLQQGGGYTLADTKSKKAHLKGAVNSIANQVLPDPNINAIDKLETIFSNPLSTKQFMQASGKFGSYLTDSPEVKTAITNLGTQLKATNEVNLYTDEQKQQAEVLSVLRLQNPALFNAAFNTSQKRMEIQTITNAMGQGDGITETNNKLDKLLQNIDKPSAVKLSGDKFVSAMGLNNAPAEVQDMALLEYKRLLPMGSDEALKGARNFMADINPEVNGMTVMYGGSFDKIGNNSLEDIMKTFSTAYVSGTVAKSGFTEPLQRLLKNDTTKSGTTLYKLNQVPGLQVSIFQGSLVLELNGRRQVMSRAAMEIELDGYKQRADGRNNNRRR